MARAKRGRFVTDVADDLDVFARDQIRKTVAASPVPSARLINTTAPLAGGGDLSADRTLTVDAATTAAAGVVELATVAETDAHTDTARAVTSAGLINHALDSETVHLTGNENVGGVKTFSSDPIIPGEAYSSAFNGVAEPPTKNAMWDAVGALGTPTVAAELVARPKQVFNGTAGTQTPFATDTYLTGSSIAVPDGLIKAKSMYHCLFHVTKTAAGLATPIINVRFGTAGSTADTAIGTLTWSAQTAAVDQAWFEVRVFFNASGSSATVRSMGRLTHNLSVTGFGTGVSEPEVTAISSSFDSTVASSILGISVNGGTDAAWTTFLVEAELVNLSGTL